MEIKRVQPSELYSLRHLVLRPTQPLENVYYDKDYESATLHLGVYEYNNVICIATFYPEAFPGIYTHKAYRLRGMATQSKERRKGYATILMQKSFELLHGKQADFIWCKARLGAISFYKALGFHLIGARYEMEGIGPHYTMYKILA